MKAWRVTHIGQDGTRTVVHVLASSNQQAMDAVTHSHGQALRLACIRTH